MKRSIISLLVAGLFAGTATVVFAAGNTSDTEVKAAPKQAETSQSRSADPNTKDAMNDTSKDAKQDKNTSDKHAATVTTMRSAGGPQRPATATRGTSAKAA